MCLSKLQDIVDGKEAWHVAVHEVAKNLCDLVTEQQQEQQHGTLTGESFLKVLDIKTNAKSHQKARKLQYQMPYTKPLAKEEHNVTS